MADIECDPTPSANSPATATEGGAPQLDVIVADLIAIIRSQTKDTGTEWSAATTIQETGINSFDFVELVFEVEDKYGIDLNFNANTAESLKTVADVAQLIHKRVLAKGLAQ